jgi:hypothetical protein
LSSTRLSCSPMCGRWCAARKRLPLRLEVRGGRGY